MLNSACYGVYHLLNKKKHAVLVLISSCNLCCILRLSEHPESSSSEELLFSTPQDREVTCKSLLSYCTARFFVVSGRFCQQLRTGMSQVSILHSFYSQLPPPSLVVSTSWSFFFYQKVLLGQGKNIYQ